MLAAALGMVSEKEVLEKGDPFNLRNFPLSS